MKLIRIIKSVRQLLFINKLRVILSLIGIAAGIASVIIMTAIGEGARSNLLSQIEAVGSNLITVDAGKVTEIVGRKREITKVTTLKLKDADVITEECNGISLVAPTQEQTLLVKYERGTTNTRIIGTTSVYPKIKNYRLSSGRFFNPDENKLSRRVAVVGQKTVKYLFGKTNPVGETIKINNIVFEIIGVLESKGVSYDGANEDDVILIPIYTGMRRVFNVDYIKNIYVHVFEKDKMKTAEEDIRNLLRERHRLNIRGKEDDFTVRNVYTALKAESDSNETFSLLIQSTTALSLVVGGIGILAIMLLSVRERKSEIGLRMAIGAKPNDILFQFLSEAIMLSFTGGVTGILAGIIGSYLLILFTDLAARVSLQSILFSTIISISIGVISGIFPARRASLTEPVKALKECI